MGTPRQSPSLTRACHQGPGPLSDPAQPRLGAWCAPCRVGSASSGRPHSPAERRLSVRLSEQDIVRTGSALLAPDTQAAWEQIQRSEGGAVQLLRGFEAYFSNVVRNVRRTYLRPFVIVTANMSKGRGPAGWGGRTPGACLGGGPCWAVFRRGSPALASGSLSANRETGPSLSSLSELNQGNPHITPRPRESGADQRKSCWLTLGGLQASQAMAVRLSRGAGLGSGCRSSPPGSLEEVQTPGKDKGPGRQGDPESGAEDQTEQIPCEPSHPQCPGGATLRSRSLKDQVPSRGESPRW